MAENQKSSGKSTQKKTQSKVPALRGVVDQTINRIKTLREWGALSIPSDYTPENAVRSAAFIINDLKNKDKEPVVQSCTKESIMNALLDMVVQGLNPMKHQCSFIPYGKKLMMRREYAGTIAMAKRFGGVKEVNPVIIYQNDKFRYHIDPNTGKIIPDEHEQSIDNIDINKIKGAYAIVHYGENQTYTELMTYDMIKAAWNQGEMKGQSPAHKNFTDQMVKKTVINRACKLFVNSSSDAPVIEEEQDKNKETVKKEIQEEANSEEFESFDEETSLQEEEPEKEQQDSENTKQDPGETSNEKMKENIREANQRQTEATDNVKDKPDF